MLKKAAVYALASGNMRIVTHQQAAYELWHSTGCKMPIHAHFLVGDLTRKVGQTDLVVGLRSKLISRSVLARLQVSVCSGYDLFHPN